MEGLSVIGKKNVNITSLIVDSEKLLSFDKNSFKIRMEQKFKFPINIKLQLDDQSIFNEIVVKGIDKVNLGNINIYLSENAQQWRKVIINNIYTNEKNAEIKIDIQLIKSQFINIIFYDCVVLKGFNEIITYLNCSLNMKISASSCLDRLWVPENLIEWREEYGWASVIHHTEAEDIIEIDMENQWYLSKFKARSIIGNPNCFPEKFFIEISLDKILWVKIIQEENFHVSNGDWYEWSFPIQKARYIKMSLHPLKIKKNEYCSKILSLDFFIIPENLLYKIQKNYFANSYASELFPGILKLAENNSTIPGNAIQGNDSRLRAGTTEYPGICQLAKDGESRGNVVVQGNDSRLRVGTAEYPGICQLAKDGESRGNVVVQGNDSRLRAGTTEYPGICQLAKDGESRGNAVVQGNDSRLRVGTAEYPGICQLAKDGESRGNAVVQGNDSRLRVGTAEYPGICQLARHNEIASNKALQSDDPRLNEASENKAGRVQLAKNGEITSLKVLQSDDDRIKQATKDRHGIVLLADHGKSIANRVVQSDDPRLSDSRLPKPHIHEYAEKNHEYNSHTGSLNIFLDKKDNYDSKNNYYSSTMNYPFSVANKDGLAAGIHGGLVLSAEKNPALIVFSNANVGVNISSRQKNAAVLISENDYALVLPKKNGNIRGSEKAIYAEGLIDIRGGVQISGTRALVVKWNKFSNEVFSEGDILSIDESGTIQKINQANQSIIGIFTKNSDFILSNSDDPGILISLSGIVQVKTIGKVRSGNKLGYFNGNHGIAQKIDDSSFNLIALESSDDEQEKLIWCLMRS